MFLPASALLTIGATEPADNLSVPSEQRQDVDGLAIGPHNAETETRENCRDRIRLVREERALPKLDAEPAEPDNALMIAAVDHQIDGCDVLVMQRDTSDVRPLPLFDNRPVELIPAN